MGHSETQLQWVPGLDVQTFFMENSKEGIKVLTLFPTLVFCYREVTNRSHAGYQMGHPLATLKSIHLGK